MDQKGFGDILRRTRERKGLDLNATARRLRIRPDILEAIEDERFEAMPPRGYARNMVNGYARYLGLNSTEVTSMYLDAYDDYQSRIASARRRPTGIDMSEAPRNTRIPHRQQTGRITSATRHEANEFAENDAGTVQQNGRRIYENPNRPIRTKAISADDVYASGKSPRQSRAVQRRSAGQDDRATHGSGLPSNAYTNFYSGSRKQDGVHQKLPFIIAAVVILVVVIIICMVLFGGKAKQSSSEVPNVPVTGLESATTSDTTSTQTAVETAPTKFTFAYKVDSGTSVWIEVYVDGVAQVAETITGPSTKSFDVTGSLEFISAGTTGVSATQDGTELTLTPNSSGIVDMTINFSDVLAKWKTDHPNSTTSATTSTATTAATSTGSTATNS
jgi:hypothetical protein